MGAPAAGGSQQAGASGVRGEYKIRPYHDRLAAAQHLLQRIGRSDVGGFRAKKQKGSQQQDDHNARCVRGRKRDSRAETEQRLSWFSVSSWRAERTDARHRRNLPHRHREIASASGLAMTEETLCQQLL